MEHSYKTFIHSLIDWDRVSDRLDRYPQIAKYYPIEVLQAEKYTQKPPYFCHPLTYQLGVWHTEVRTSYLNELLAHATTLPGWQTTRAAAVTAEFQTLHAFYWELEMAKFLADSPADQVRWRKSGPDLEVSIAGQTLYVECYCYVKYYARIIFLHDLLSRIDERLHVKSSWAIKSAFPSSDRDFAPVLDRIFEQVTPQSITLMEQSGQPYFYIDLPSSVTNIYVYFENENIPLRHERVPHMGAGDTDLALEVAVQEAINNKAVSNGLSDYHPNLVAINMALSRNFLLGHSRAVDHKIPPPKVTLPAGIDGAVLGGIVQDGRRAFDTVFDDSNEIENLWRRIEDSQISTATTQSIP